MSLVTGLLALGPVAVACGLVALRRVRVRGTRGRGLALAGVVLGVVGTLAAAGLVVGLVLTARTAQPLPADVTSARSAHARQLVTGNCVDPLPTAGTVDTVHVVPCAQPHAAQVITEYAFAPEAVWPGQDRADARVAASCALSTAEQAAGVRAVSWAPTEQSWGRGDRLGLCLATSASGQLTGSLLDGSALGGTARGGSTASPAPTDEAPSTP